jgi:hypothetical protein
MKKLFISIMALTVMACGGVHKSHDNQVAEKGNLSFAPIESNSSSNTNSKQSVKVSSAQKVGADSTTTVFDFGDIKSTETYLFQLKNTGTVNVNNVSVSSDNSSVVVVSPGSIAVLPTEGVGGITPLISVQVVHGVGINGYGTADLLPKGPFSFNLTASGVDTNGNTVSSTCEVDLNVLVASFTLSSVDGVSIPMGSVKMEESFPQEIVMPFNGWYVVSYSVPITAPADPTVFTRNFMLTNTGNCSLEVINEPPVTPDIATPTKSLVSVGQAVSLACPLETVGAATEFWGYTFCAVKSGNTVFNMPYPTDTSGNYFFYFLYSEQLSTQ